MSEKIAFVMLSYNKEVKIYKSCLLFLKKVEGKILLRNHLNVN